MSRLKPLVEIFSGGQRQRLTIARALLKKAFLDFDDSTSALDYLTEARLLKSIKEELNDTSLISQRTNSLKSADQILVLNKGRHRDWEIMISCPRMRFIKEFIISTTRGRKHESKNVLVI